MIIIGIFASLLVGIPDSDAFFEGGIVVEVPGQIMELSDNVISPGQTMFVNGTFNQSVDDFTANIFKNYENSRELVLTLSPSSNEFGDFSFNFTIPQDWKLGNYHIVLENGLQEMHWEFAVRKNHTGISLDRTVYPASWEMLSPLKQIKSGIAIIDVQCNEGKSPAYKYNRMSVACVSEETLVELWSRGWATMRFYTDEDTSPHALCNNYDGKWHPEHNGCRGDISDLQCSLMGGKFVDNLKICYNDICPENKTYTLCVVNSDEPDSDEQTPEPPSTPTQCRPGLPPFTTDFYLDKELCKWKLIPEPAIDEAIPYVWNAYLHKMQIDFSPKEGSYTNADEGYFIEKETRVCSPLILSDGTEQYISSTFTVEPFEIIDIVMSETKPDDCHKIWKTDTLLVEPSPELGAWLEKYWEKEDEN